jgi:hypothetical protein
MDTIRNKVQESGLINLDLADFKPNQALVADLDIANQLWQGLVLKEKDFRTFIAENDWSAYAGKYVYIHCSADAIVPTWAYMLVSTKLLGVAAFAAVGTRQDLEKEVIRQKIAALDIADYEAGRISIKGCADISSPEFAMVCLVQKLQPVAKSIMYGEPCSTVPIYKAPKN